LRLLLFRFGTLARSRFRLLWSTVVFRIIIIMGAPFEAPPRGLLGAFLLPLGTRAGVRLGLGIRILAGLGTGLDLRPVLRLNLVNQPLRRVGRSLPAVSLRKLVEGANTRPQLPPLFCLRNGTPKASGSCLPVLVLGLSGEREPQLLTLVAERPAKGVPPLDPRMIFQVSVLEGTSS
jgi:hypothetical protein